MPTAAVHTVLVPGLLCSARLYDELLPAVWSYGGATVADTRRDSTMTGMARRLLDAAPDRFALVGLSMGGYVALEVMRLAPERVSALGLISTSARPDSAEQAASRREQQRAVAAGRFTELVEAVYPVLVDAGNVARPDLAGAWRRMALEIGPDAFVTQLDAAVDRPDSRPDLASIRCPTSVIHGTGDRLIAAENAVELADGIPGARLTLVQDAGHMIAQEQPAAVAAAVSELLDVVAR
ncbi:MAG: alpha/beta hydrolase [Terracoccus sp.]